MPQLLVTTDTGGVCADDLPLYVPRFYGKNSREIHIHAIIKCLVSTRDVRNELLIVL